MRNSDEVHMFKSLIMSFTFFILIFFLGFIDMANSNDVEKVILSDFKELSESEI